MHYGLFEFTAIHSVERQEARSQIRFATSLLTFRLPMKRNCELTATTNPKKKKNLQHQVRCNYCDCSTLQLILRINLNKKM